MKKILITGGAGFIGCHLADKLSKNLNNDILIVDNLYSGKIDRYFQNLIKKKNVRFINLDLIDLKHMKQDIWTYYDNIYHLAAIVGVKHCMKSPEKVLEVNIKSTFNIERLVRENNCGKILFSSSCEVYASGFKLGIVPIPTDESVPISLDDVSNPRWSYAISKIVGEQLFIFNSKNSYDYSIVRYHNIFGPRQGYTHVIPEVIRRILSKENPFKVFGYNQTRSFCYIDDAINQTIAVMENDSTNGEIINIGNDNEEINILDLYKKIFEELNYNGELLLIESSKGSVMRRCPDLAKIKRLTNFNSLMNFKKALKSTISWYLENIS